MSVIDRYWEWRRRRALRARERTHALALVVDALIIAGLLTNPGLSRTLGEECGSFVQFL